MLMEDSSRPPLPGDRLPYHFCEYFRGREGPAAYQHNTANQTNRNPFNGMISGIWLWHPDHRISWVRTVGCRQRAVCGRIGQALASTGSWCIHRHISDSKRRLTWRLPVG